MRESIECLIPKSTDFIEVEYTLSKEHLKTMLENTQAYLKEHEGEEIGSFKEESDKIIARLTKQLCGNLNEEV